MRSRFIGDTIRGAGLLFIVALAFVAGGWNYRSTESLDRIEAKEIFIVSENGENRISLGTAGENISYIMMHGQDQSKMTLLLDNGNAHLVLRNGKGDHVTVSAEEENSLLKIHLGVGDFLEGNQAGLDIDNRKNSRLWLADSKGTQRVLVGLLDDQPGIFISDENEDVRIRIAAPDGEKPEIEIIEDAGEEKALLPKIEPND